MNARWSRLPRHGPSSGPAPFGCRAPARLFAFAATLLILGSMLPTNAMALEDGEYTMQCFCPVSWTGDWDGNGIFDEDASRDTIALASGDAVLLIHELPIDASTLEEMTETRTEDLERNPGIDEVDVAWDTETAESINTGRSWVNADGDTILGYQVVMVWEQDFLLSIEFVALEDDFEDAWSALDAVSLVGVPISFITNSDDVFEEFGI
jgi:hypothetical protein